LLVGRDGSDASAVDASLDVATDAASDEGGLAYMVGIKTNGTPTGPAIVEGWLKRPLGAGRQCGRAWR
jgi:hypothetical protein